jgi:hypothetical protein
MFGRGMTNPCANKIIAKNDVQFMPMDTAENVSPLRRAVTALRFTKSSYFLLSLFLTVIALILVVWWPLAQDYLATANPDIPLWKQMDWLLVGIFLVMTVLIMAGADIKRDAWMVLVGLAGGLAIEGWGTQTLLWSYYTAERPPLWIIPAWPIATLAIDRLTRLLDALLPRLSEKLEKILLGVTFGGFYILMLFFVWPTLDKSLTILALIACALLPFTPANRRTMLFTFIAGSALGYFLELWGTTRACWTYYTLQTPPFFAVLAHGLAAAAFWRIGLLVKRLMAPLYHKVIKSMAPIKA